MIRTRAELLKVYGNHYGIAKMLAAGKLTRVGHGLYCDDEPALSEVETICAAYPNAVLTMESAFSFHGLSDYIPDRYCFATPLNAHRIRNVKVMQFFMSNQFIRIGVEERKSEHGVFRVYDRERMLIELFRLKGRFPPDYFREIVNAYRALAREEAIDFRKLASYCRLFKKGARLMARIEEVIL